MVATQLPLRLPAGDWAQPASRARRPGGGADWAPSGPRSDRRATAAPSGRRAGGRCTPLGPVVPARAARGYRLVGAFAALLATCAVWAQAGGAGHAGNGPLAVPGAGPARVAAAHVWVVQPGDTIWAIARRLQRSGDVRPLVDTLVAETHGRPLQVGQQLTIP